MKGVAYCEALKADIVIEVPAEKVPPDHEGEILIWLQACAVKVAESINEKYRKGVL